MELLKCRQFIFLIGFFLFLIVGLIIFPGGAVIAANYGDVVNFNVDKNFDASARTQLSATLIKTTKNFYFYVEKSWWDVQPLTKQTDVLLGLDNLSLEFDNKIHPTLTSVYGSEWKPGVDGDDKITILFEAMNSSEAGYFREADEYVKLQIPTSNEREMLYLSLDRIDDSQLKIILAHEFVHLITFNQKNKIFNVEDDTWLNEARADFSSTILDYDDKYADSNLNQRVSDFIENSSDSITEWTGTKNDYASVSMFTHYLVDHYSVSTLIDSLKSKHVGIESINYALRKNGFEADFAKIFTDWTIASILNNCSVDQKYCYLSQNLKNFRLAPAINFLPVSGDVSLSVTNVTKSWTGNWLKFIGGNGELKFNFSSLNGITFKVPYILQDSAGAFTVKFLALNDENKGEINLSKFGANYKSLIIIPSLQSQIYKTDDLEPTYPYSYMVSITGASQTNNQTIIQQLLDRIAELKKEIAKLQNLKNNGLGLPYCGQLNSNLYMGIMNDDNVRCLQQFLKEQGVNVYPEGLVTGNFGNLTKQAVVRFQAKYGILQTGFVGPLTRNKINSILNAR